MKKNLLMITVLAFGIDLLSAAEHPSKAVEHSAKWGIESIIKRIQAIDNLLKEKAVKGKAALELKILKRFEASITDKDPLVFGEVIDSVVVQGEMGKVSKGIRQPYYTFFVINPNKISNHHEQIANALLAYLHNIRLEEKPLDNTPTSHPGRRWLTSEQRPCRCQDYIMVTYLFRVLDEFLKFLFVKDNYEILKSMSFEDGLSEADLKDRLEACIDFFINAILLHYGNIDMSAVRTQPV